MKNIILISCSSNKLPYKAKAKDLYIGSLFKKSFKYAKLLKPNKIFILSAKHELLDINKEIAPYNVTLNNMGVNERREWSENVLKQLEKETDTKKDNFIFLTGKKYREFISPNLKNFVVPMEGLAIGKQLHFLNKKINI